MKKIIAIFLIIIFSSDARATGIFDFNNTCQQAYVEITKLKFAAAKPLLAKAKQQNQENIIVPYLENYIDFFTLFLNEDPFEYKKLKKVLAERMDIVREGPDSSPFKLYCLCMLYMQRGSLEIKFGETWSAAWDIRKAYLLIKENRRAFPTFAPNDLMYGGLDAIVGTIPQGYKWLAGILGLKGSVTEGMQLVRNFVNSQDTWARLMNNEAVFAFCFLQFHLENKKTETIQFITTKKLDLSDNHLFTYMAANLIKNYKQPDIAKEIILNRNKSSEYLQTPVWDFELGFDYLYHLDTKDAIYHFEKYVNTFKGKFYVKDVYQKISWAYYLQDNMAAAEAARKNILTRGGNISDADKQALKEAKNNTAWPNTLLLKVRLLNDGGYNKEALALLIGKTVNHFDKEADKVEFTYRVGRINDDLNKFEEAIYWYNKTMELGEKRPEYFAARASLQAGMILEKKGDKVSAINYYKKCLDMEEEDFKNSIDQKAKAGIARCKGE